MEMREMKDSGISWIADIPEHWSVSKIGGLYSLRVTKVSDRDYPPLSVTNKGILPQLETAAKTNAHDDRKLVCKGDFAINSRSDRRGSCGISSYTGSVSLINTILRPMTEMHPQYYDWLFHTIQFGDEFYKWGHGIVDDLWTTGWQDMKKISIPTPPITEQAVIADFLDEQCAEIDSLISDIQSQIEALEEYKRSVITEAVTKGLDSDVEMRDSGVQWIGKIPKHWAVDNPKWHFVQRKDRATKGLTQLTASQKYGVVTQEEYMEITGAKVVTVEKDFDILKLVCPGDFIIHMRSFQGGLEYSEKYGSISSAYVMLIPQKTILEPRFYKWFFKSPVYIDALSSTSNLIRDGQAMRYANFIQLPIPLMPKEEQQQIADYLDSKCAEIDSIIAEKKQQIETIEEYKKSLIFEYVTGKKEVQA
jgi:type I restriction enzyme S subunit